MMRLLLPGLCCVLLCGCADGRAPLREVSGTVLVDGVPLGEGDIIFIPLDKTLGAEAGHIENGKFKCKVRQGKQRVEIRASKMLPLPSGKVGAMGETALEQDYLPDRYHTRSGLAADITADGPNELEFKLTTK